MTEKFLTITETADALNLGISSVRNWLESGNFPGSFYNTKLGWLFPESAVLDVQRRMAELREKNLTGDIAPPDCDDDLEVDLL